MKRAWIPVVAGAFAAPLVTWFPMLAHRFPWLGLPAYPAAEGGDLWHLQAFWLIALGVIAVIVGRHDRWLGVMVAVVGLTIFLRGAAMDPTHSVLFALGAVLLVVVRRAPAYLRFSIRNVLVLAGAIQIAYVLQQRWLGYDLLWGPLFGGTLVAKPQPIGTLLGVDAVSSYIAVIAPLMPLWLLPLAAYVVVMSQSLGAIAALVIGLAVAYRRSWRDYRVVGLALIAGFALLGAVTHYHIIGKETQKARVGIWTFAAQRWVQTDPILGYGLGGWAQHVPQQQLQAKYLPTGELWREAHNEPLQWVIETGAVGSLLLGLWLWEHRRMFAHPLWGGSLAALASACLTWHPLHIVSSALVGLIVIGMATRTHKEAACAA